MLRKLQTRAIGEADVLRTVHQTVDLRKDGAGRGLLLGDRGSTVIHAPLGYSARLCPVYMYDHPATRDAVLASPSGWG